VHFASLHDLVTITLPVIDHLSSLTRTHAGSGRRMSVENIFKKKHLEPCIHTCSSMINKPINIIKTTSKQGE